MLEKNLDAIVFATEYKNLATKTLKNNYVKDKLKIDTYVPIVMKIGTCENLVITSCNATKENGKKEFHINTPVQYIIYSLSVVNLYTNLIIDFSQTTVVFDALNETGLLSEILDKIPEKELKEFSSIKTMVLDDYLRNKWNIYNFTEEQITKATALFGTFVNNSLEKLNYVLEHFDKEGFKEIISSGSSKVANILNKINNR